MINLEKLPVGRVVKRFFNHKGRPMKMRIVKPTHLNKCDICGIFISGNAVRTEAGGNLAVLTQCFVCAYQELGIDE